MMAKIHIGLDAHLILLLYSLIHLNCVIGQTEETQPIQTVRAFLSDVLSIEISEVKEHPGDLFLEIRSDHKICLINNGSYSVYVSEDGSVVYGYNNNTWYSRVYDEVHAELITESEVFDMAVPLLKYLGLTLDVSDYEFSLRGFGLKTPDNYQQQVWRISRRFYLNGKICRSLGFSCLISATSGDLIKFVYNPIKAPQNNLNVQVSYKEACDIASSYISQVYASTINEISFANGDSEGKIVVAPDDNELGKADYNYALGPPSMYYSWEVKLRFVEYKNTEREYSSSCIVYVNIETGEVVGGFCLRKL